MKYTLLFLLLLFFSVPAQTQILLTGKVIDDEKGYPLPYVMVTLKNKSDGIILAFTQTATDGTFKINSTLETIEKSSLHFSLMGYKENVCTLTDNEEQKFYVRMVMTTTQIKEVTIKARKIWEQGDTLVYNVSSFANDQDRTIGEVLKKMPGIDVQKDGQIYYNGVSINKFYIEGKDLLEGRYGIATNGIPQKDVGRVEVMENHQPIKALEGFTYSQQAALNLRLKEGAKAKWVTTLEGEAGISTAPKGGLWNGDFFAMAFKSKLQNITTIKSNNTGELYTDIRDFSLSSIPDEKDYIVLGQTQVSDLEQERTTFNRTHLISSNTLWSLGKDVDLKTQIHYMNNRQTSESYLATTYYLPEGIRLIKEKENALNRHNSLAGVISLEANKDKSFLKNILKMNFQWDKVGISTDGTFISAQDARVPVYQINNSMQWVKRLDKKAITFTSVNEINLKPQHLSAERDGQEYRQDVDLKTFYTSESASFGWNINKVILSFKGGIEAKYKDFNTNLRGVPESLGLLANNLTTGFFRIYAGPEMEYTIGKWKGILAVPVSYYHYELGNLAHSKNDMLTSPSLSIHWNYSTKLAFHLNGNWSMKPSQLSNMYEGWIMQNYRTLFRGTSDYATGRYGSVSGGLTYKQSTEGIFGFLNVTRLWNKDPFRDVQQFVGDYRVYALQKQETKSDSWLVIGNFSKSIDWIYGTADINLLYNNSNAILLSEGQETPYKTDMWNVKLNANSQVISWLNFNYELMYGRSSLDIKDMEKNTLHGWQHNIKMNIIPHEKWVLQLSGEYYRNEVIEDNFKDMLMANCKVTFNLNSRLELTARLNNVFNKRQYNYTIYNGLSSIRQEHNIRGREFLIGFSWR